MKKLLVLATIATLSFAPLARAEDEGTVDQATKDKITQVLTDQGYEVRKIVAEEGNYEVYVIKDGTKAELFLDPNFKIVKSQETGG